MSETLQNLLTLIRTVLVAPSYLFTQNADVRFYWAYLALVPALMLVLKLRGGPAAATIKRAFAKDTWIGDSARVDFWIFTLNLVLQFSVLSGLLLSAAVVAKGVTAFLASIGTPQLLSNAGLAGVAALTITAFVAADFGKFLAHYLAHRIPAVWELHKVHHAAETLNPLTAERFHPLEIVFDGAIVAVILGAVNGLLIALAGPSLTPWEIAGANVLWFAANLAGGPLRHMPVWFSYGPKIEHWILSPAQHQIHHSDDVRHYDKNLGSTLALWDRLFGTLYVTRGVEDIRYGLGAESAQFRTAAENYWRPVAAIVRLAKRKLGLAPAPSSAA
ncbi:MAG: sterol desaturase family protein [Caulobacterales bacterium]